jgi:hypothetical protein
VPCDVTTPTTIQIFSYVGWGVSFDNPEGFTVAFGSPTATKTVSDVPVSSTLSLIGLAFLALAVVMRATR